MVRIANNSDHSAIWLQYTTELLYWWDEEYSKDILHAKRCQQSNLKFKNAIFQQRNCLFSATLVQYFLFSYQNIFFFLGYSVGQVVSMLAFDSNDPSSDLPEVHMFYSAKLFERGQKVKKKRL